MQSMCKISGEGDIVLFKNIRASIKSKLTWYLILCVIFSGVMATLFGGIIVHLGLNYLETIYDDEEMNRNLQKKYIEELQEYITEKEITKADIDILEEWLDENTYIYLSIYQNNRVIFNSEYTYLEEEKQESVEVEMADLGYLYKLKLADGTIANADIFCYDYMNYYYYVYGMGIGVGLFIFLIVLMRLIQRKIRYINSISKELQILEGGNLEYPITVKGKDEIAKLAMGIEQMRLSIIENIKKEQEMLQGNKDLVTSMSHDLRTPLTTLTGYLELLNMDYEKDEEKRKRYLALSLAKSREIKELSDDLFEYFLIYGENEKKIAVEPISAWMLAEDLIENQFLSLEAEGYHVLGKNHLMAEDGNCMMNAKYMQRVLNNVLSNLKKYANQEEVIDVSAYKDKGYLVLKVTNGIAKELTQHESTKIGLITCDRIMKLHHGEFRKIETETEFSVEIVIPMEES